MRLRSAYRPGSGLLLAAALVSMGVLAPSGVAWAAGDIGHPSITYSGVSNPPTSDKPQSKLWWNAGSWWADMWKTGSGWHIYRLDRSTETWVDTGVLNDTRGSTLADVLWDGTHLYIASHVVTVSSDTAPVASAAGQPAKLYRYSFSGGAYTLDSGFPSQIGNNSSESMTIDEDSTGVIWATWTQVAGNAGAGWTNTVYVNASAPGGTSWPTPFVIPASDPHPGPDDISALVAYKKHIGVMWSDQLTGSVFWAIRADGTSPTAPSSWRDQSALKGNGLADDHLNLKTLQADASGRVFAAVKTSLNDTSTDPSLPQLLLLTYNPGTGAFGQSTISTTGDCVTRPQVLLDGEHNVVHVFQTAPASTVSGCAFSGVAGSIYEKTASMDNPVFAQGRGTPIIEDSASANLNNVTTTKGDVNSATGLVVLASNDVTKRYWFADESLSSSTAPGAPTALVATGGNNTVALTWAAPTSTGGSPITGYNVYRGTSAGAENTTPIATNLSSTNYTDNTAVNGTRYYYTVTAANTAGTSPASGEASATPQTSTAAGYVRRVGTATAATAKTTTSVSVGSPGVVAGHTLVVSLLLSSTSSITGTVSATDTAGNTYTGAADINDGSGGDRTVVLTAVNAKALAAGSTITLTYPSSNETHLSVDEFSGVTGVDKTAKATGTGTSFNSGLTTTTTQPNEILVGAVGAESATTPTWATGWTALPTLAVTTDYLDTSYRTAATTGTYSATGTTSNQWMAGIITLTTG